MIDLDYPRKFRPLVEQARTLASLGRLDEAEAVYQEVIQLLDDPARAAELSGDVASAYTGLARLLLGQDRIDEATQVRTQPWLPNPIQPLCRSWPAT